VVPEFSGEAHATSQPPGAPKAKAVPDVSTNEERTVSAIMRGRIGGKALVIVMTARPSMGARDLEPLPVQEGTGSGACSPLFALPVPGTSHHPGGAKQLLTE
jgi:hypothetical protein